MFVIDTATKTKMDELGAHADRLFGYGDTATTGYVLMAFPMPLRSDGKVSVLTMSNMKHEAVGDLIRIVHQARTFQQDGDQL